MLQRLICGIRRRHLWVLEDGALICRRCPATLREKCQTPPKVSDTLAGRARHA